MKNKVDGFKTFYNDKKGKYILFFGFYLIFFIFLAFYIRSMDANLPKEEPKETPVIITTYDISNLINNDYKYNIKINDDGEEVEFNGTKSNIDYANYSNKYFLDIYNINQLLKRSKQISSENNLLTYELLNSEINDILLTNREEGINKIEVYVSNKGEIEKIDFDLSSYLNKEKYEIMINYTMGEKDENSSS